MTFTPNSTGAPDFVVEVDGRRMGVEAHSSRHSPGRAVLRDQVRRAEAMLSTSSGLEQVFLVYPAMPARHGDQLLGGSSSVRIVTLDELADAMRNSDGSDDTGIAPSR
jgi:hypothetical protein